MAITELYSHISGLTHAGMPTFSGSSFGGVSSDIAPNLQASENYISNLLSSPSAQQALSQTSTSTSTSSSTGGPATSASATSTGSPATFQNFTNEVLSTNLAGLTNWLMDDFTIDPSNPMADIVGEGNVLLESGEGILTSAFILAAASNHKFIAAAASAVQAVAGEEPSAMLTAAGAVLGTLAAPFISMAISAGLFLMAMGAVESVILPMIFYVTWLFALLNVIAFAAEFVLAAPLAAFQHMRFDGQKLVEGEQKPFYSLMFNGVLRPCLLLFGLFISTFVLDAVLYVFNATYKMAIIAVQANDFIGVVQTGALVALQVFIQYQVLTRCVSLIHRVPHMVAKLLNADVPDLVGHDEGRSLIIGAAGYISNKTTSIGATMMKSVQDGAAGQRIRGPKEQIKDDRKGNSDAGNDPTPPPE